MSGNQHLVRSSELRAVASLAAAVPPTETKGEGVLLEWVASQRQWSHYANPAGWALLGEGHVDRFESITVPARLLWSAAEIADDRNVDWVTLGQEDAAVVAQVDDALVVFDQLDHERQQRPTSCWAPPLGARGSVPAGVLARLLRRTQTVPVGLDISHSTSDVALVIEDGAVALCADWGDGRTLRSTLRTPAQTVGRASCEIDAETFHALLLCIPPAETITLSIGDEVGGELYVDAGAVKLRVPARPTAVQRLRDGLGQRIADAAGGRCFVLDEGIFTVELGTRPVRLELHDDGLPVLRVTTTVVEAVQPTSELYRHLNDTNAGLTGVRVWLAGTSVVAGVDLTERQFSDLAETFWRLETQLDGFDVFLSALGQAS